MKGATSVSIFLLLLLGGTSVTGQQALVLSTPGEAPYCYPDQTGIMDRWLQEAFSRIGISVTLEYLPPERSLLNADAGLSDGDAVRIAGLGSKYPNLIQVPEKVYDGEFVAFSKRPLPIKDWNSLADYDVAFITGHKVCELNIRKARSITQVKNVEQLMLLLKNDRADVVVVERLFGMAMLKELGIHDAMPLEPPLARMEFFIYLNRKHEALVPGIAEALAEMKRDGTHDRIYREGLARLIIKPAPSN